MITPDEARDALAEVSSISEQARGNVAWWAAILGSVILGVSTSLFSFRTYLPAGIALAAGIGCIVIFKLSTRPRKKTRINRGEYFLFKPQPKYYFLMFIASAALPWLVARGPEAHLAWAAFMGIYACVLALFACIQEANQR
ncbi:hypothetical protein QP027_08840 [Corynebacterium breve]|uniref:Uncharacterized protein n=1 Tax=Corynebacterium breve TaxID=3049799 RepID=A0ABY8VE43_9CORY|nr:hypothetical protein [Corynebacterium breve]WIM67221.1 hypothetical protein QP027_08840 [Corynebacterium breve]